MSDTEEPTPKKRIGVRTLNDANDVRRLLSRIIKARLACDGTIDDACLRAVSGACGILLKAVEQSDLESKLGEITKRLDEFEAKKL